MKNYFTLIFFLLLTSLSSGQNIVEGEYFLENDPGVSNGTSFTLSSQPTVSDVINLPTSSLAPGFHTLLFRVKDDQGRWSHYEKTSFYILENTVGSSASNLVAGEYFLNTDPGVGNGTPFTLGASTSISSIINLPTSSLNSGFHSLFIRVKDDLGKWSHYESASFYILENTSGSSASNLVAGEYFLNTDPGIGNGTPFTLGGSPSVSTVITLPTTSLNPGFHSLFIRVKDDLGKWSHYESASFYILENASSSTATKIVKGEYFIDNDPGIGNGTSFSTPSQSTLTNFSLPISLTALADGDHSLHIRLMDSTGKWSHYETKTFYVCGDLIDNPSYTGTTTFCQGQQIKVTGVPVNNISSFFWTGPNDYFSQSVVLIRNNAMPSMSGTYTFSVVSAGGFHCDTNSISVNITVNPSYNPYQQVSICYGDTLHIGNKSYSQSGFYTTYMTAVNGCDSTITTSLNVLPKNTHTQVVQVCEGQTYTIGNNTYTENGTYIDTLITAKGCDSIVTTNLFIGDPIINTQVIFLDSTLTSLATDVTYQWLDCENEMTPIPNATSSQLHLTKNGKYAVRLTSTICPDITAMSNCYDAYNLEVSSALVFENVKVFPNPNKGILFIETNDFQNVEIEITDLQGRLLFTSSMNTSKIQLDLESYAVGTYLLKLSKDKYFNIYKIVKE